MAAILDHLINLSEASDSNLLQAYSLRLQRDAEGGGAKCIKAALKHCTLLLHVVENAGVTNWLEHVSSLIWRPFH